VTPGMTRSEHIRLPSRDKPFPRKVRNGLKLKHKEGFGSPQWPAGAWLSLMETWIAPAAREEGFVYATSGQLVSLLIEPGRIDALVQGRAGQPYRTVVSIRAFETSVWDSLIEAMAAEAVYAAKLLGGEAPIELSKLGVELGAPLAPLSSDELSASCTCGGETPCKHVAAVLFHFIERLLIDARLLFTLRGMRVEHMVMRLQEARSIRTQGVSSAHTAPMAGRLGQARPLEECLDDFWRPGPQLEAVESAEAPAFAPHALLRRLGPSPMGGKFPLVGLLASIYDTVSDEAKRLASTLEPTSTDEGIESPDETDEADEAS
jgi:uncharacterized Zn finger protein